jgi:hypothetical protein
MRYLIILLIAMAAASMAAAWDLSGNNQSIIWISKNEADSRYNVLQYREACDLRISGTIKQGVKAEVGLRFLSDQETWDDGPMFSGFSKRYLQLKFELLTARAGTYYATLGRGLVLNCANEQAAKIDRYLDGAMVAGSLENIGEARLVFGRIFENTKELDTTRTYLGAELKYTELQTIVPGLAYLRSNAAGEVSGTSLGRPVAEQYSGSLSGNIGPLEYYGEYGGRRSYGMFSPTAGWVGTADVNGHAFYGSLSGSFSGVGLMLDFKNYRDFDAAINAPPPCNREGRLLNNGRDERGVQIDLTATPWSSLELHGNLSWSATVQDMDSVFAGDGTAYAGDQKWSDLYAEGKWEFTNILTFTGEVRARREDNLQPDIMVKKYLGGTAGYVWRYGVNHSLTVKAGGNRYRNIYLDENLNYDESLAELGWVPLPNLNLFATAELADKEVAEYEGEKSWGEMGCTIDLGNGQHQVKLSAGKTKGGLVCSGGFCRWEPAFQGFKAVWDWRF